jgi:undecaprenyl diphosphate synthase
VTTAPQPSLRGPAPGHVAWVATRRSGAPESAGRDERALLVLVETALDVGVRRLSIQDPSGGRPLRSRAAELARRGVAIGVVESSGASEEASPPEDLVPLEDPALRVLLAEEGSGRGELVRAVRDIAARAVPPKKVSEATIARALAVPDVDLLVLTGGDRRVPDLLVWQVAYSEIVVLPEAWPEVSEGQFRSAIAEYQRRDRRYGGLVAPR